MHTKTIREKHGKDRCMGGQLQRFILEFTINFGFHFFTSTDNLLANFIRHLQVYFGVLSFQAGYEKNT